MSPRGIAGPPDQSSQKSFKTCYAPMPFIVPNLIAIGQTMYEKSVIILYTLQYFGALRGLPEPKLTNLSPDVQQGPLYQSAKFRPALKTCL